MLSIFVRSESVRTLNYVLQQETERKTGCKFEIVEETGFRTREVCISGASNVAEFAAGCV
jgi:hypothetical protein